jgi:glycosyltransferase involved in cell wall biosynthesis
MKIEFLILGQDLPSSRFRVLQYLPMLEQAGSEYHVVGTAPPFFIPGLKVLFSFRHRLKAILAARRFDLIFLQKADFVIRRGLYLRLLFRRHNKVIFDFDDAIFIDPDNNREFSGQCRERLQFILGRSRLVISGNEYLAAFARRYNKNVVVIPTPIDTEKYIPAPLAATRDKIIIGWMGTEPNLKYLMALWPVMHELLLDVKIEFLIISNNEKKAALFGNHERNFYKKWQVDSEVFDLQQFDIGIMPLADDPFTRGKCGFKLLQYMAVGIPVVASPVGMNRQIVEDGSNGFLAANDTEWLDQLRRLCRGMSLRAKMGRGGRETVVNRYGTDKLFKVFFESLQQVDLWKQI